jgi:low affinity Fe/Cu permease
MTHAAVAQKITLQVKHVSFLVATTRLKRHEKWQLQYKTAPYFITKFSVFYIQYTILLASAVMGGHYVYTVEQTRGIEKAVEQPAMLIGKN